MVLVKKIIHCKFISSEKNTTLHYYLNLSNEPIIVPKFQNKYSVLYPYLIKSFNCKIDENSKEYKVYNVDCNDSMIEAHGGYKVKSLEFKPNENNQLLNIENHIGLF